MDDRVLTYSMPRSFGGFHIPISIQGCYMRDYMARSSRIYPLPIVEFCIPKTYAALESRIKTSDFKSISIVVTSSFIFSELDLKNYHSLRSNANLIRIECILEQKILTLSEIILEQDDIRYMRGLQYQF